MHSLYQIIIAMLDPFLLSREYLKKKVKKLLIGFPFVGKLSRIYLTCLLTRVIKYKR
ncbi:hypothetical protein C8J44_3148 [Sphingomonas sp. PP-CE-3A-406]|nr:hypothetical protein C8J44_3148 [Sphingomonas sp. PP-CE-3A-406]